MTDVPRLRWPLRLSAAGALDVVEQDSTEDIEQCVRAILRTRIGDRVDRPAMGVLDPTFAEAPPDVGDLVEIVDRHEPRVRVSAIATVDVVEQELTHIDVQWQRTATTQEDTARG